MSVRKVMSQRKSAVRPATAKHEAHENDNEALIDNSDAPINMPKSSHSEEGTKKSTLDGDRLNIAVLIFLYVLQGIPLGLAGSIPYLLQSRKVSYKDQAMFSFVYWPFSVKLLWAPIVDALYISAFGRRKSWLVPVQYLIGIFMLVLSNYISWLMGEEEGSGDVSVFTLTVVFFMLNFLAATQDIAVDGWALTMLSRRNVGWASTCNTVGQTAGYFMGNVVFLALESEDFCRSYLGADGSVVTLASFLVFWGVVFLVTTTLVAILKHESREQDDDDTGVVDTYLQLWGIVKLPSIIQLVIVLLTCKVGFAAADALTGLKLIEEGVPKEKLALLGVPMVPIQIILPLIISKYTTGPKPLSIFLKAMPCRLLMGLVFAMVVYIAPSTKSEDGVYPFYFYVMILLVYAVHQVFLYSMFVSQMSFFAKISDPLIGGTYMTLLNTITNFGGNWPSTLVLWMADGLTWRECDGAENLSLCDTHQQQQACAEAGGSCVTTLDGYYIESFVCLVLGFLWLRWRSRTVLRLQDLGPAYWSLSSTTTSA